MIECKICNFKAASFNGICSHISKRHNIKEYYDKYLIKENDGKCLGLKCENKTNFIGLSKGYRKYCSRKCMANSKEVKEKKRLKSQEKYGTDFPNQAEEIKRQKKETNQKIRGIDYPMQSKEVVKKREDANKVKNFEDPDRLKKILEKNKQTSLINNGVDNIFKNIEYIKECTFKKLGVEYTGQYEPAKEKKEKTCHDRYGGPSSLCSKNVREKGKQVLLNKYGVDNIFKDTEYIKKCNINKWGIDSWTKTSQGRKILRLNRIKFLESLFPNGQKINPREGKNERIIAEELQSKINKKFLRKQCIGGLFPDLLGESISVIVEIDENGHLEKSIKIHDKIKDEYYISKGYIPIRIKESDWFEDKELQIIKVQETINFLEQVQSLK